MLLFILDIDVLFSTDNTFLDSSNGMFSNESLDDLTIDSDDDGDWTSIEGATKTSLDVSNTFKSNLDIGSNAFGVMLVVVENSGGGDIEKGVVSVSYVSDIVDGNNVDFFEVSTVGDSVVSNDVSIFNLDNFSLLQFSISACTILRKLSFSDDDISSFNFSSLISLS